MEENGYVLLYTQDNALLPCLAGWWVCLEARMLLSRVLYGVQLPSDSADGPTALHLLEEAHKIITLYLWLATRFSETVGWSSCPLFTTQEPFLWACH